MQNQIAMTRIIIIETDEINDFELIKRLVVRLGLPMEERHIEGRLGKQETDFINLLGSKKESGLGDELSSQNS
jgi:hypothetical protein